MKLHEIPMPRGARKRIKMVGRGSGSGHGKTSGKGHKGLKARSGAPGKLRLSFEGGQMSFIRRIPKRGFRGRFKTKNQIVNVEDLNQIRKDDVADPQKMKEADIIKNTRQPVKILGNGELKKPLTVKAHAFSKSAVEKIKTAGGTVEYIKIEVKDKAEFKKPDKPTVQPKPKS